MLTFEQAKSLFHYENGELYRKTTLSHKNKVGDIVGRIGKRGYKYLTVYKKKYYVHRIIWLLHYGNLPKAIDHIDGNSLNNNIENLRACNQSQNLCNARLRSDNTSGVKGVDWFKPQQRWRARVKLNKKAFHLGYFHTKEEAIDAVMANREKIHKDFSRYA